VVTRTGQERRFRAAAEDLLRPLAAPHPGRCPSEPAASAWW
jgi:hypothetical protein